MVLQDAFMLPGVASQGEVQRENELDDEMRVTLLHRAKSTRASEKK